MKKFFKDFYGGTASITLRADGTARLIVCDGYGRKMIRKDYASERGARIAMGKCSDGWVEKK